MKFWQAIGDAIGVKSSPLSSQKIENANIDSSLVICSPIDFKDIMRFVAVLRKNEPVIVNFASLKPSEAERSLDFVCGAVCALDGRLERIGEGIYFFAPKKVKVEIDKKSKGRNYAD